jgi:hypothetical protein
LKDRSPRQGAGTLCITLLDLVRHVYDTVIESVGFQIADPQNPVANRLTCNKGGDVKIETAESLR